MITKTDIENYLLIEIAEEFEPEIDKYISQMTQYIETVTNRKFIADEEFVEKVYDGTGKTEMLVDDFIELDSVKVDGNEITPFVYPVNTTPKFQLYSESGFSKGKQNVTVSAKWGYSEEVPADIRFACTVLVAGIVQTQTPLDNEVLTEKIGNYQVTYKDERQSQDFARAQDILTYYRHYSI